MDFEQPERTRFQRLRAWYPDRMQGLSPSDTPLDRPTRTKPPLGPLL
jgi:hypothetical protein